MHFLLFSPLTVLFCFQVFFYYFNLYYKNTKNNRQFNNLITLGDVNIKLNKTKSVQVIITWF